MNRIPRPAVKPPDPQRGRGGVMARHYSPPGTYERIRKSVLEDPTLTNAEFRLALYLVTKPDRWVIHPGRSPPPWTAPSTRSRPRCAACAAAAWSPRTSPAPPAAAAASPAASAGSAEPELGI